MGWRGLAVVVLWMSSHHACVIQKMEQSDIGDAGHLPDSAVQDFLVFDADIGDAHVGDAHVGDTAKENDVGHYYYTCFEHGQNETIEYAEDKYDGFIALDSQWLTASIWSRNNCEYSWDTPRTCTCKSYSDMGRPRECNDCIDFIELRDESQVISSFATSIERNPTFYFEHGKRSGDEVILSLSGCHGLAQYHLTIPQDPVSEPALRVAVSGSWLHVSWRSNGADDVMINHAERNQFFDSICRTTDSGDYLIDTIWPYSESHVVLSQRYLQRTIVTDNSFIKVFTHKKAFWSDY